MAKKAYVGITNLPKNISDIYVGVNNVPKKVIKGYVGVNGKAQLFWEYGGGGGGDIDQWFTPKWSQKYIQNNLYNLDLASIEKTIKYPLRRAIWLSSVVDESSYEYLVKCYKNIGTLISRVNELIIANPTWNIVKVYLTTRLPEDSTIGYQVYLCSGDLTDKKLSDGSQRTGGGFRYNFRYSDGTYRVVNYHKYLMVEFYGNGNLHIIEYDTTNYTDAEVMCSTSSDNPYEATASNIGIYFSNEEETDLVDYIELRGKTKEFNQYVTSGYSLNSVTVPTSVAYNNINIDENGATFTNDVSFMAIPEWWIFQGYYYIEIEFGYIPSSVSTVSDYIMLLQIVQKVGIAYNKSAGVWGVWDRERNIDIFRPSQITELNYFANSKVKICFDLPSSSVSVYKGETLAFNLPFIYRSFDLLASTTLYIGGIRTASSSYQNCIAGMVIKCIKVYKNRLYHNIIKKAYHDADPYITEGMFDIPITLSNSTTFSYCANIYDGATLTRDYVYGNFRIVSNTSKIYLALLHSRESGGDVEYFAVYVSENPFTVEIHTVNEHTSTNTTSNFSSNGVTLNGITYYFLYQSVGWKIGGSPYRHKNYNCSFNLSITSGTSANGGNRNTLWQLAYLVFTGTIVDY